jgi:hypothetical protein
MNPLSPLDAGMLEYGPYRSGLSFPPKGWTVLQRWGDGYVLRDGGGLRVLIDCELKADNRWWVHVSVSRKDWTPSHADIVTVKQAFMGERYAYSVWPPSDKYVNIHEHCLHLWALCEGDGRVLPEFSEVLEGVGRSV